jgi:hypothetical protein
MDFAESVCEILVSIPLGKGEHDDDPSDAVNKAVFDQLSHYQLLKEDSVPCT